MTAEVATPPPRFRPRFTLGALLILILLCALPLGYVAQLRSRNAARHKAFEQLVSKGVRFHIEVQTLPQIPGSPIKRTWWMKLTNETPTYRSIDVLEGYAGSGQPPQVFITDEELHLLAYFPEIESISLTGTDHITDKGLATLAALPKLRNFHANCLAPIDGEFLKAWSEANTIEHLTFWNMARLKGESLAPLEKFTQLRSLSLMSAVYLDKTPLDAVNMPPQLVELRILYTPVTDEALSRWLSQTILRALVLDTKFSRQIAPQLRQQTQLSVLNITNSPLTDDDLMFLGRCPALYNLAIVGAPVEGRFLKRIPQRNQIDFMTLRGVPLTDENAAELRRFGKLTHLDLGWTTVTGEFLAGAKWPMLSTLDLWGTRLSDAGKKNLAEIEFLASATVRFPANWSALDLKQRAASSGLLTAELNEQFANEAKANAIAVSRFEPLSSRTPDIDRAGAEEMKGVAELLEQAKSESAAREAEHH